MGRAHGLPTHCTIEGCERRHKARGLCELHYRRQREGLPRDEDLMRGEWSVHAKLTEQDVHAMREAYQAGGVTLRELGDAFGISNVSVYRAVSGKQWRHVN